MNSTAYETINILDRVRLYKGVDKLKNLFQRMIETNPEKAVNLINCRNLRFCSVFVLQPDIERLKLSGRLNWRNQTTLNIVDKIMARDTSGLYSFAEENREKVYPVLKWILETGSMDDGLNNYYDKILDMTALLLTRLYNDKSVLHIIAHMLFMRHRKGLYTYDLLWAFFESCDPGSLVLIANGLISAHRKDVELACELLSFVPGIKTSRKESSVKAYLTFLTWIEENHLFLYRTGESFQQFSRPMPYAVFLEAKYLCKAVSEDDTKTFRSLSENEIKLLERFRKLDNQTRVLLADYSFLLYRQNADSWNTWLHYPVEKQLEIAKAVIGGLS